MTNVLTSLRNRWLWLIVALAALGISAAPLPAAVTTNTSRHFRIEASSFEFEPGIISVNQGDHVTIELLSTDVVHGLYLDGYDIQVQADPGQSATLSFTADKQGSFRFRCSVTCGALHPFMIGQLKVGPNGLLWRSLALGLLVTVASIWRWHR